MLDPTMTQQPTHSGPQAALEPLVNAAERALALAKRCGAQGADVMASRSVDFEVKVADGRLGFCTTSDFAPDSLAVAVERAVQMAREAAADPC
ncbi:MAG: hypothetical protein EOO38_26385, partial [Cytophagaceae bacterium]